ncbi:MAG: septum formation initiator family protein [Verrucomicrobiota bacterium]
MNGTVSIWDRLTQVILILLVVAGVLAVFVWYLPLIQQNERMRKEILRLEAEVKRQEDISKRLKTTIDALRDPNTAPKTVERLAREQLGYAKPGETVIRFEEPITNAPPAGGR